MSVSEHIDRLLQREKIYMQLMGKWDLFNSHYGFTGKEPDVNASTVVGRTIALKPDARRHPVKNVKVDDDDDDDGGGGGGGGGGGDDGTSSVGESDGGGGSDGGDDGGTDAVEEKGGADAPGPAPSVSHSVGASAAPSMARMAPAAGKKEAAPAKSVAKHKFGTVVKKFNVSAVPAPVPVVPSDLSADEEHSIPIAASPPPSPPPSPPKAASKADAKAAAAAAPLDPDVNQAAADAYAKQFVEDVSLPNIKQPLAELTAAIKVMHGQKVPQGEMPTRIEQAVKYYIDDNENLSWPEIQAVHMLAESGAFNQPDGYQKLTKEFLYKAAHAKSLELNQHAPAPVRYPTLPVDKRSAEEEAPPKPTGRSAGYPRLAKRSAPDHPAVSAGKSDQVVGGPASEPAEGRQGAAYMEIDDKASRPLSSGKDSSSSSKPSEERLAAMRKERIESDETDPKLVSHVREVFQRLGSTVPYRKNNSSTQKEALKFLGQMNAWPRKQDWESLATSPENHTEKLAAIGNLDVLQQYMADAYALSYAFKLTDKMKPPVTFPGLLQFKNPVITMRNYRNKVLSAAQKIHMAGAHKQ